MRCFFVDLIKRLFEYLAVILLEFGGLWLIGFGLYKIYPPLGWIFGGIVFVKVGYSLFENGQEDKKE